MKIKKGTKKMEGRWDTLFFVVIFLPEILPKTGLLHTPCKRFKNEKYI